MTIPNSHEANSQKAMRGSPSSGVLWSWALGVIAALFVLVTTPQAAGRAVSFRAFDGRTVNALLMEAVAQPAPAVVLVPMLGRPKDDWQAVAQRFADAGITALAIDLPGLNLPGDPATLIGWADDVRAAVSFLVARPAEVRAGSVGIMGASLGANLAAVAAATEPLVRAIALVSPSLDYRGVRIEAPLTQYGARPAMLVASLHDPYAARSVRELARTASGARQMRWSETVAHGTMLLARDPDLVTSLIEWFQLTLG
jgi:dienelactone hydrolase